MKVYCIILYY